MTSKNIKISERISRFEVLHVLFCLRAEVFYGGLGLSKFQFLILKYIFSAVNFCQFWAIKPWTWNWIRIDQTPWIRIRNETNADPQHALKGQWFRSVRALLWPLGVLAVILCCWCPCQCYYCSWLVPTISGILIQVSHFSL